MFFSSFVLLFPPRPTLCPQPPTANQFKKEKKKREEKKKEKRKEQCLHPLKVRAVFLQSMFTCSAAQVFCFQSIVMNMKQRVRGTAEAKIKLLSVKNPELIKKVGEKNRPARFADFRLCHFVSLNCIFAQSSSKAKSHVSWTVNQTYWLIYKLISSVLLRVRLKMDISTLVTH